MDDKDKEWISKQLQSSKPQMQFNFSSIAQAVLVAGVIGLYVQFDEMKQNDARQSMQNESVKMTLHKLERDYDRFSNYPVFSKNDFKIEIKPIIQTLDNINSNQREIKNQLKLQTERERALKMRIDALEIKLRD